VKGELQGAREKVNMLEGNLEQAQARAAEEKSEMEARLRASEEEVARLSAELREVKEAATAQAKGGAEELQKRKEEVQSLRDSLERAVSERREMEDSLRKQLDVLKLRKAEDKKGKAESKVAQLREQLLRLEHSVAGYHARAEQLQVDMNAVIEGRMTGTRADLRAHKERDQRLLKAELARLRASFAEEIKALVSTKMEEVE
jgi:chromosome segregation ATPase